MKNSLERYKVDLPDGEYLDAKVDHYEIAKNGLPADKQDSLAAMVELVKQKIAGREIPPGRYTRLHVGRATMMSDTPSEIRDSLPFIRKARGHVLITGLGLGVVPKALLKKKVVKSITIIEKSKGVIALVAPYYQDPRLRVIHADAFEWEPDRDFDCAWHDIWPSISDGNWEEMQKLRQHYPVPMTMCWAEDDCEAMWLVFDSKNKGMSREECLARMSPSHLRTLRTLLRIHGVKGIGL